MYIYIVSLTLFSIVQRTKQSLLKFQYKLKKKIAFRLVSFFKINTVGYQASPAVTLHVMIRTFEKYCRTDDMYLKKYVHILHYSATC